MDFALILVVATAAAGAIWAVDSLFLKRGRVAAAARGVEVREPIIVEYGKSFFPILLLVLAIRSFVFEPFRIPSGSMMPTLLEGDFIFVNKFAYGLRLPVLNTKVFDISEPQRGDVVVFRLPEDPKINYIKRVVGLPGDTVYYDETKHRISINGKLVDVEMMGAYEDPQYLIGREQLGAHDHHLLLMPARPSMGGTFAVPAGHYFMMGDNRDSSSDSRYWGFVPEQNIVGKAFLVWWNFSELRRIGNRIN